VRVASVPTTAAKAISSVVEKFRDKYGVKDVKKYYSKFDVAVVLKGAEVRRMRQICPEAKP